MFVAGDGRPGWHPPLSPLLMVGLVKSDKMPDVAGRRGAGRPLEWKSKVVSTCRTECFSCVITLVWQARSMINVMLCVWVWWLNVEEDRRSFWACAGGRYRPLLPSVSLVAGQ